jgi:hypothetical protein
MSYVSAPNSRAFNDIENRLIMLINLGYSKEPFIAQRTVEAINDFKILYQELK